jgi:hypothetical protein
MTKLIVQEVLSLLASPEKVANLTTGSMESWRRIV